MKSRSTKEVVAAARAGEAGALAVVRGWLHGHEDRKSVV